MSNQPRLTRLITGKVHAIGFLKASNTRGTGIRIACIGDTFVYTAMNSGLGSEISNYRGKQVECQVKLVRDRLVIIDIKEVA